MIINEDLQDTAIRYEQELLERIIPFWETHGIDRKLGGFFSVLGRNGELLDATKYMWLQWRAVYMYAALHNSCYARPGWLENARQGFDFLAGHGLRPDGSSYFALDRAGRPICSDYGNYAVFTDSFAAIAAAELYAADQQEIYARFAVSAMEHYQAAFKALENTEYPDLPGRVPRVSLGHYMILVNVIYIIRTRLKISSFDRLLRSAVEIVVGKFWDPERRMMFEHIARDGSKLEGPDGRLLNPGHALEAMWFIMQCLDVPGMSPLKDRIVNMTGHILEYGWDDRNGGIFYFKDCDGLPLCEGRLYLKTWWCQCEAMIAALCAWKLSGDGKFLDWFRRVDKWSWRFLRDQEFPEWFAHVLPDGRFMMPCKGNQFKGFFHIPRFLLMCLKLIRKDLS